MNFLRQIWKMCSSSSGSRAGWRAYMGCQQSDEGHAVKVILQKCFLSCSFITTWQNKHEYPKRQTKEYVALSLAVIPAFRAQFTLWRASSWQHPSTVSPKNSGFPNISDSKKNKLCQFCRMCSFLFTASGGKKHSDSLKHDGKRYSSKRVLAEERPHSFTMDGRFSFSLNRGAVSPLFFWVKIFTLTQK